MEERILKEISHIVACLDQNAGNFVRQKLLLPNKMPNVLKREIYCTGGIMTPQTLFHNAASNVISLVLFGTRFDYKDEFLKRYVQLSTEISKIVNGPWNMVRKILDHKKNCVFFLMDNNREHIKAHCKRKSMDCIKMSNVSFITDI